MPTSIDNLAEAIASSERAFSIQGTGTKTALGNVATGTKLSLSAFNKVNSYEPEESILDCGAATKLADIQELLASKNQMLAFEPPDFSKLFGSTHSGTIGGALMCNLAGPRRMKMGAARDHILGITGVNGQGEIIKAGARVVKNVTGYDLPRLMAGSYGTLMALTTVIFKTLPKPETENTLLIKCDTISKAIEVMTTALASNAEVSSASFVPGHCVALRLEGILPSINARRKSIDFEYDLLAESDSQKFWETIRDCAPLWNHQDKNIWRISVAPSEAPGLITAWQATFDFDYYCDWAGGLIWMAASQDANPRPMMKAGHATLWRGHGYPKFHPQAPALAALSARVKKAFDPHHRLNPGRMV